jgi:hypothetical protein
MGNDYPWVLAFVDAGSTKRKRGRPRKHPVRRKSADGSYSWGTLLTASVEERRKLIPKPRGRPIGKVKYSEEDLAWLRERVSRRQDAAVMEGRMLSTRQAIFEDAYDVLVERGMPRIRAVRRAKVLAGSLSKLLYRRA